MRGALSQTISSLVAQQPKVLDWSMVSLPETTPGAQRLREWLDLGYHADMEWMQSQLEQRIHPMQTWLGMRSAILVLWKTPQPLHPKGVAPKVRVAAYAQGEDYHIELANWLRATVTELKNIWPAMQTKTFSDALPIAERDLAALAGLGWLGKNAMLIHPRHGSSFLIGGILLDTPLEIQPQPIEDRCSSCTRCLEACPTGALTKPGWLDSNKCISWATIERRVSSPVPVATYPWVFGCDICQDVCPWNLRHSDTSNDSQLPWPESPFWWQSLMRIGGGLNRKIRATPLQRAGTKKMRSNWEQWLRGAPSGVVEKSENEELG